MAQPLLSNSVEALEFYRSVFERSPIPMCIVDGIGNFMLKNEKFQKLTGEELSSASATSYFEILMAEDRPAVLNFFSKFKNLTDHNSHGAEKVAARIYQNGNLRKIEMQFCQIHPELTNLRAFVILLTDEVQKIESVVVASELQKRAQRGAARLSAIGEMVGAVIHEINNPLAVVLAKVEQIRRNVGSDEIKIDVLKRDVDKVHQTAGRIAKIIAGLRVFSHSQHTDPLEFVSPEKVVTEAVALCHERIKMRNIELIISEFPLNPIECKWVQIAQVIVNLLNNSVDAIDGLEEKWIKIQTKVRNEIFEVVISDSGLRISPENVKNLGLPFYTTKTEGKGTGLGLSIAKTICEDHKGKFYYNAEMPNTSFVIEIPLKQAKDGQKAS